MSPHPATSEQSGEPAPGDEARYPGAPRWVKVSVGLILLFVLVIVVLTALGLHTPGGPGGHGF